MQVFSETFQVYGRLEILPANIAVDCGAIAALIHWEDQDQTGLATAQDLKDLEDGCCAWMRKAQGLTPRFRRARPLGDFRMTNDADGAPRIEPLVRPIAEAWCIVDPHGNVEISSDWRSEDDAWRVRLGWPTRGEVRHAKASGWRCERVSVLSAA